MSGINIIRWRLAPVVGLVLPVAVAEQEIMAEAFPLSMVSCGGGMAVSRGGTAKRQLGTHTREGRWVDPREGRRGRGGGLIQGRGGGLIQGRGGGLIQGGVRE